MEIFKKILMVLLVLNLIGGGYLFFRAALHTEYDCYGGECGDHIRPSIIGMISAILVTALSLFLPLLLLTLIETIEILQKDVDYLRTRINALERVAGLVPPTPAPRLPDRSAASPQGSLSERLGKL